MKRNNRFIFVVTCLMFTISFSGLFGTMNINKQLNLFVNENNLTHEEIQQIIHELNQLEGTGYNKKIKKGLKKIGRLKEKEAHEGKFPSVIKNNIKNFNIMNFFIGEDFFRKRFETRFFEILKAGENILRLRE